jgi:hypothetical protein
MDLLTMFRELQRDHDTFVAEAADLASVAEAVRVELERIGAG